MFKQPTEEQQEFAFAVRSDDGESGSTEAVFERPEGAESDDD